MKLSAYLLLLALPPLAAQPQQPQPCVGFLENLGQVRSTEVRFVLRHGSDAVFVLDDGFVFDRAAPTEDRPDRRAALRYRFLGSGHPTARAGSAMTATSTTLLRSDANGAVQRHRAGGYQSILLRNVAEGAAVRLRSSAQGLAFDLLLDAGHDGASILVEVDGADCIRREPGGSLRVALAGLALGQSAPVAWQTAPDGTRHPTASTLRLLPSGDAFTLEAEALRPDWSTTIDPTLRWSTYLGGGAYEFGYSCAVLPDGDVVVTGETASSDFPTTTGAYDATYNGFGAPSPDVFVARLTADGSRFRWATYVGGSSGDKPYELAVDGSGRVVVVGNTASANFPVTNAAPKQRMTGRSDAFAFRLAADGSSLDWSTFLGGRDAEVACAVALDARGGAVVTGVTSSSDFPVTAGTFSTPAAGNGDAFVTRIAPTGDALSWSTRFGGGSGDNGHAIAIAPDGSLTIAGVTSSPDFPTTPNAFQSALSGNSDTFVLRLSGDASNLLAATLVGGGSGDVAEAVSVTVDGDPVLCGVSSSSDYPTTPGAFQSAPSGNSDTVVTRVRSDGTGLVWSTLIGGSRGDVGKSVLVDSLGAVLIGGQTASGDYPTSPDAPMRIGSGSADGFVSRLSADGSGLLFSTLVGGSGSDGGEGLGSDGDHLTALIGVTGSRDLPGASGSADPSQSGTNDGFVALLDVENGLRSFGAASPACALGPTLGATRRPASGEASFGLLSSAAPHNAAGFALIGLLAAPNGLPIVGIDLYVDLSSPPLAAGVAADGDGLGALPLPLAGVPAGAQVFCQFLWLDPAPCSGSSLRATPGLEVTVQ